MFDKSLITNDIGIDLGTSTVLVYVRDKGIVLCEPSVVAIDTNTNKIVRIGKEAAQMMGRAPANISIIHPLKDGVISQYNVTLKMLQYYIRRACGLTIIRPRVMICVPTGISEAEELTVINASNQAGARHTLLIEEPIAAAIGAGVDIHSDSGRMVVDIGGGTTDIAVIAYGGAVASKSIRVAGNEFDEAIIAYMRKIHKMEIGERTAEEIKIKAGSVFGNDRNITMPVKGRCMVKGLPKVVNFTSAETLRALNSPLKAVIDGICSVIEKTPPELLEDVYRNGIVLTGGGAKLHGLDKMITKATGIRTRLAKDPVSCVVVGTGKSLEAIPGGPLDIFGLFSNK